MSVLLVFFYLVFLCQIFVISIFYPSRFVRRVSHIVENYPPSDYPKLYPKGYDFDTVRTATVGLKIYQWMNRLVALVGLAILGAMLWSGYQPDIKGGDEIFVLLFFGLQVTPHIFAEFSALKQYRLMRHANSNSKRTATLSPRKLFDFVSPILVGTAALMFIAWVAVYLYDAGLTTPWQTEVYWSLGSLTLGNLVLAAMVFKFIRGKKHDPYIAQEDQNRVIRGQVLTCVITSIAASSFLIIITAVRAFNLDIFEPVLNSLYLQMLFALALELTYRNAKVERIDFDVYRNDLAV